MKLTMQRIANLVLTILTYLGKLLVPIEYEQQRFKNCGTPEYKAATFEDVSDSFTHCVLSNITQNCNQRLMLNGVKCLTEI